MSMCGRGAKFVAAEGEVKISEAANETGLTIIVR